MIPSSDLWPMGHLNVCTSSVETGETAANKQEGKELNIHRYLCIHVMHVDHGPPCMQGQGRCVLATSAVCT